MGLQLDRYPDITYESLPSEVDDLDAVRALWKWEAAIGTASLPRCAGGSLAMDTSRRGTRS